MSIKKRSHTPYYRQVAAELRARIRANEWQPGEKLPPEDRLAHEYSVGKDVIRDALWLLRYQGLIVTRNRIGSFVRDHPTLVEVPLVRDATVTARPATPEEVDQYELEEGDPVLVVTYPDGQSDVLIRAALHAGPPADDG